MLKIDIIVENAYYSMYNNEEGGEKGMPMKPRKMIRLLKKYGAIELPKTGGHRRLLNPENGLITEVPMHTGELKKGTQEAILRNSV